MSNKITQGFSLDKEVNDFIDSIKWDYKTDRSKLVNAVLNHFREHESELKEIIDKKLKENQGEPSDDTD